MEQNAADPFIEHIRPKNQYCLKKVFCRKPVMVLAKNKDHPSTAKTDVLSCFQSAPVLFLALCILLWTEYSEWSSIVSRKWILNNYISSIREELLLHLGGIFFK